MKSIDPDGKAEQAGVQKGDVITEINHQLVKDTAAYARILREIQVGGKVQLFIRRLDAGFVVAKLTK